MKFRFTSPSIYGRSREYADVVTFPPAKKYEKHSHEAHIVVRKVDYGDTSVVHIQALDKEEHAIRAQWTILHADVIPDLILALQYLQAGTLGRELVKIEMERAS